MFREIKYWIADHLFEYELDEAFRLGVSEGQRSQAAKIRLELQLRQPEMTKTQLSGYEMAREMVKNASY
jgi:hypothetical protein